MIQTSSFWKLRPLWSCSYGSCMYIIMNISILGINEFGRSYSLTCHQCGQHFQKLEGCHYKFDCYYQVSSIRPSYIIHIITQFFETSLRQSRYLYVLNSSICIYIAIPLQIYDSSASTSMMLWCSDIANVRIFSIQKHPKTTKDTSSMFYFFRSGRWRHSCICWISNGGHKIKLFYRERAIATG